jgi:putative ABC transport system substrate-binding protein
MTLFAGAALACPGIPRAAERLRRVGVLVPLTEGRGRRRVAAFQGELQKLGWAEGRNIQFDVRWTADDAELAGRYALELVALAPDAIVLQSLQAIRALRAATDTMPLVILADVDLVAMGIVDSLAHPGGNVTGFTLAEFSIGGKRLELLKAVAPDVTRALNILPPRFDRYMPAIEASAAKFMVQVTQARVHNAAEITEAIETFGREPNGALIVHPDPVTTGAHPELLIALAAKHRLPAIYPYRGAVQVGGLMSYGFNWNERWRSAAGYVDLILRGARPADLPVQNATKIELVINLKTAKALGLKVPPRLIAGADEVIQ